MISKSSPSECYVYITLPGTVEPVTAARFTLTADRGVAFLSGEMTPMLEAMSGAFSSDTR